MNHGKWMNIALSGLLAMAVQSAWAQNAPEAQTAVQSEAAAQEAYEEALLAADREKEAAMVAVEEARRELEKAAELRERSSQKRAVAREAAREAEREYRAEREAMRRELSRVQEELRRASREVVRAHRELDGVHARAPNVTTIRVGSKAVIGVILGDSTEAGVEVLGVSPGGPAESAGLKQGDIIVSVMGQQLAENEDSDAGKVLLEVMESVKPGDELDITVQRDDGNTELTFGVVAEEREPLAWTSMIRLPSAPAAPGEPIVIEEIIEVPQIDRAALAEKMERLREDLERRRIVIAESGEHGGHIAPEVFEFDFQSLSDIGEDAMYSANVWFGMPLTRGLELAEVNEELGDYFKADHGVLVLSANAENDLQLVSGDVVVAVAGKRVDKPSDLMRELRDLEPGSTLELEIMRKRRSKTIEVVVPEQQPGFGFVPGSENEFFYRYHVDSD